MNEHDQADPERPMSPLSATVTGPAARMSYTIRTRNNDPREARVVLRMTNGDTFDVTPWLPTVPAAVIAADLDKLRELSPTNPITIPNG